MKKQFLALMAVTGILALGACEQDSIMDKLEQDVELNQKATDNEDEKEYKPGEKPDKKGGNSGL